MKSQNSCETALNLLSYRTSHTQNAVPLRTQTNTLNPVTFNLTFNTQKLKSHTELQQSHREPKLFHREVSLYSIPTQSKAIVHANLFPYS